uniref:Uncharacterized protein n=1 Tax=Glossina palpalis gambiensis TaxID=67801 RepID=A0A1B0APT3_9MUSC
MASEIKSEKLQKDIAESTNGAEAEQKSTMSFKDWKTFKEALSKPERENRTTSSKNAKERGSYHTTENKRGGYNGGNYNDFRNGYNNGGGWNRGFNNGPNCMPPNFCAPNFPGPNFYQPPSYNNCFGMNFGNGFCPGPNFKNYNPNLNSPYPNNFFAKDGMYRQRDNMQKPLSHYNPFRNGCVGDKHANELNGNAYTKGKGRKPRDKADQKNSQVTNSLKQKEANKIPTINEGVSNSDSTLAPPPLPPPSLMSEPKIYVKNPRPNTNKPFIPMPRMPEQNSDLSPEERKKQWKEYREAMKPFKNREFHNAKRRVQRLSKKHPSELDEKEKAVLAKAQETMAAHKLRLSQKYSPYIRSTESQPDQLGEVYVLKQKTLKYWDSTKPTPERYDNYGNFGENVTPTTYGSGRIITGGHGKFQSFVPGGVLEGTIPPVAHQN